MKRLLSAVIAMCLPLSGLADEGMWTIDNFPSATVAKKYDVNVDEQWLRSAQLATTRLENGCTGSFASADGLVL
ncbi:MAG: S46 family peptidase, partial [Gammaproteobacteria bacterium]|nr:S46 family peptidase [Gammaproteobacteria bacterium]